MKNKTYNPGKLSSFIFYISILIFIIAFNFSDNPPVSGWQQQFMPNFNNRSLAGINFTDSLTGYAIISNSGTADTSFIIKTTNGGNNWFTLLSEFKSYYAISFLNNQTGYVGGSDLMGYSYLAKTTNNGISWIRQNTPGNLGLNDIAVLNEDTIWIVDRNSFDGGIFRTTNGGISWIRQYQNNSGIEKIYMFNGQMGFASSGSFLFKTTNSGFNWNQISGQKGFLDMYFSDSLTGWKNYDTTRKTTDGGYNWISIDVPRRGSIYGGNLFGGMYNFENINKDTIWGAGGYIEYPGFRYRGILYRTTNGGNNWFIQIPDTSFGIPRFFYINFTNNRVGWSYLFDTYRGIHTNVGGDTTFFTKINNSVLDYSMNYLLFQNYPNPFNPKTVINYNLRTGSYIIIKIYDALGKELSTLVNQKQNAGTYKVDFDGSGLSSGVYFYTMFVNGKRIETKKMMLLK